MTTDTRPGVPRHPAAFSDPLFPTFERILDEQLGNRRALILDPFAGIGKVHQLATERRDTIGVELMPKWAAAHRRTRIGDASHLDPAWTHGFDAIVTSPCYGNRMADHHDNADTCKRCGGLGGLTQNADGEAADRCSLCGGTGLSPRRSYRHYYGDGFWTDADPTVNAGVMQWGDTYREFHERCLVEMHRVLRRRGVLVLNIGDHYRAGRRQYVSSWWLRAARRVGFERVETWTVSLVGHRHGANRDRVGHEFVHTLRKVTP